MRYAMAFCLLVLLVGCSIDEPSQPVPQITSEATLIYCERTVYRGRATSDYFFVAIPEIDMNDMPSVNGYVLLQGITLPPNIVMPLPIYESGQPSKTMHIIQNGLHLVNSDGLYYQIVGVK